MAQMDTKALAAAIDRRKASAPAAPPTMPARPDLPTPGDTPDAGAMVQQGLAALMQATHTTPADLIRVLQGM